MTYLEEYFLKHQNNNTEPNPDVEEVSCPHILNPDYPDYGNPKCQRTKLPDRTEKDIECRKAACVECWNQKIHGTEPSEPPEDLGEPTPQNFDNLFDSL